MKLVRTKKLICVETIDENFIRHACSLGGKHSNPLKAEFSRFTVTEKFRGEHKLGGGSIHPWSEEYSRDYDKTHDGIEISLDGFDTDTRIWQNGNIQGYYKESYKVQYGVEPIKWIQLLLDYGFIEVSNI